MPFDPQPPASAANIGTVEVVFQSRQCAGNPGDSFPAYYTSKVTVGDGDAVETFKSTVLAYYNAPTSGDPTNKSVLDALAAQIAADWMSWKQASFDQSLVGVAAIDPTGLADVEWDLSSTGVRTRLTSAPPGSGARELGHFDWTDDASCGTSWTANPCAIMYGPMTTQSGGSFAVPKYRVCLIDGRITSEFIGYDTFSCGCNSGKVCIYQCSGSQGYWVPVVGVKVVVTQGSNTVASGMTDATGCISASLATGSYTVTVSDGDTVLWTGSESVASGNGISIFINCCVPVCLSGCVPNPYGDQFVNLAGASVTVAGKSNGTSVTGTTDSSGCVTITFGAPIDPEGYTYTMTYGGQTVTLGPYIGCQPQVQFYWICYRVLGCLGLGHGVEGATVTNTVTGVVQVTDANGYAYFLQGTQAVSSITITCPPRFQSYPAGGYYTEVDYSFQLAPADGYICCSPVNHVPVSCNWPICTTIDLTDPVTGAITLIYTLPGPGNPNGSPGWIGSITYNFPGFCGCPADTTTITYFWDCIDLYISVNSGTVKTTSCDCIINPDQTHWMNCPTNTPDGAPGSAGIQPPTPRVASFDCDPLDVTLTATGGCTCSTCHGAPCGCATNNGSTPTGDAVAAIWGPGAPVALTWTITDGC